MATTLGSTGVTFPDTTTQTTAVPAPSTSGNVLTSNGTTWQSTAPSSTYAGTTIALFPASGTWTPPTGITKAIFLVIGGGGGAYSNANNVSGGTGGALYAFATGLTGSYTVTIGAGGATGITGVAGGTSSITGTGVSLSATGGAGATSGTAGASGIGTVTTGTAIKVGTGVAGINFPQYGNTLRTNGTGTTGTPWVVTNNTIAGIGGTGSPTPAQATGGVGGLIVIIY